MKTLLVIRHAKSDWTIQGQTDRERPLNSRGKKQAKRAGKFLRNTSVSPSLIVSSSAARASMTAAGIAEQLEGKIQIREIDELYSGDAEDYIKSLASIDDDFASVAIVGHNPTIEELIASLTSKKMLRLKAPTAAIACIVCEIQSWKEIESDIGRLDWFVIPKVLDTFEE